jgi:hypothetical protein
MGICSIGAQLLRNMEGQIYLRILEIKRYIKGYIKMPCKWVSLSTGVLFGNLVGICLLGLFFLKEKDSISGFLSWTQRTLRFYV